MSDAKAVEAVDEGADEFWMQLLRPILIMGIVLGVLSIVLGFLSLTQLNEYILTRKRMGRPWLTPQVIFGYAIEVGVPLCLIIGAIRGLKRQSNARLTLLIYAWVSLGLTAYSIGMVLWDILHAAHGNMFFSLAYSLTNDVWQAAFPAILLILLTRKPIAELFHHRDVAFEVMPPPPDQET